MEAIRRIKARGATVVLITHRTMLLSVVDKILVMKEGAALMFGPRDQVLAKLMPAPASAGPDTSSNSGPAAAPAPAAGSSSA